jgi:hypothetical protein
MSCSRLERENLLSELGGALDPHIEQCEDCRERVRGYEQIMRWIAEGRTAHLLPPTWKQRTLERIDEVSRAARNRVGPPTDPEPGTTAPRCGPPRWRRTLAVSAVALPVAAVLALLLVHLDEMPHAKSGEPVAHSNGSNLTIPGVTPTKDGSSPRKDGAVPAAPQLAIQIAEKEGWRASVARPDPALAMPQWFDAHPGQVVHARALSVDARYLEIRVYRGDRRLVVSCPAAGPPVCVQDSGARFTSQPSLTHDPAGNTPPVLVWKIPSVGTYRVVLLASQQPIAPPRGSLNDDVMAASSAGAKPSSVEIHVR